MREAGARGAGGRRRDRSRCVVLVPVYEHVDPACEESLELLELRGYEVRRGREGAAVDLARIRMATEALDDGFDELMWVDADIAFEADAVDRLRAHGLSLAMAFYPKRAQAALAGFALPGTQQLVFGEGGGLVEVHYGACGFLHSTRAVYEDVQRVCELPRCNERFGERLVPYFLPMVVPHGDGHWYLPEDYAFFERARRAGHRVHVDTTIRVWHVGRYAYSWEDAGGDRPRFASYTLEVEQTGIEP